MNKFIYLLTIFMFLVAFLSCRSEGKSAKPYYGKEIILLAQDQFEIETNYLFDYSTYSGPVISVGANGREELSVLSGGRIFTFSLDDRKLVEVIEPNVTGPNSMETTNPIDGIYPTGDGAFIYVNQMLNHIYRVDSNSAYLLSDLSEAEFYFGTSFFARSLKVSDNYFFSITHSPITPLRGKKSVLQYNDASKSYKEVISYPDVYYDNYFGATPYLYWPSVIFNSKEEVYVVSYPVTGFIHVYDENLKFVKKVNAASSLIGSLKPLIENFDYNKDMLPDWKMDRSYFTSSPYYAGLQYDAVNQLYYRLARVPVSEDVESGYTHSYVVLNEDFKMLGEVKIPDYYRPEFSYCDGRGLNILNEANMIDGRKAKLYFDLVTVQ